ncbi:hypothetical protein Tco_0382952 [Tanacetum coccineum]
MLTPRREIPIGKDGVCRVHHLLLLSMRFTLLKRRGMLRIFADAHSPKEHMKDFHGMDDRKSTGKPSELAQCAEVSTKMLTHKFLKLCFSMVQSGYDNENYSEIDIYLLMILYNNLSVFEQEIKVLKNIFKCSKYFFSQSKSSTNKVKSGFSGAYSSCTPSTSSTNIPEKEVLAGFANEIDDVDIEEMDINWQIAMIAIRMKKFYKKTGRRVRVDGKTTAGFDKKKAENVQLSNTVTLLWNYNKGTHDGKKKRDSFYQHQEAGKQEKNQMGLLTMDDGIVN